MEILDIEKQSIVLLTSYFKRTDKDDVNPLSPAEWKIFAGWLRDRGYTPGNLLSEDGENIIESWKDKKITSERLIALLKRGAQMSMVLEKWSRAGIWILTRSDGDYPQKLKTRLGQLSPPVIFGSGNKKLLNVNGIAVVGSRNVTNENLMYSKELGKNVADNDMLLISGGAKGVDESSMIGALENEGRSIGVLGDGLFQRSISLNYRKYLTDGTLTLISSYYPDAGFNVGNAMGRNKYIYCLSEAAVVVHSGLKGGTWTGAIENLKKKWVPLFVKENNEKESGNTFLIKNGGIAIKDGIGVNSLIDNIIRKIESTGEEFRILSVHEPHVVIQSKTKEQSLAKSKDEDVAVITAKSIYEFFIDKVAEILQNNEVKLKELKDSLEINSTQLNEWLKRAEADGIIKKLSKPIRYTLKKNYKSESDLFNSI